MHISEPPLLDGGKQSVDWRGLMRLTEIVLPDSGALLSMIHGTSVDFFALQQKLSFELKEAMHQNILNSLSFRGESANVLFRNLFERTADIGFLSMDQDIVEFLIQGDFSSEKRKKLQERFQYYTQIYTVYDDIILFDLNGEIVTRMKEGNSYTKSTEGFIRRAIEQPNKFMEEFGNFDFISGNQNLLYSQAVCNPENQEILGVLVLSFRLKDEMQRIFARLHPVETMGLCLTDNAGRILFSSDSQYMPIGHSIPAVKSTKGETVIAWGRKLFCISREGDSYQGYEGPGWRGVAIIPHEDLYNRQIAGVEDICIENPLQYAESISPALGNILHSSNSINSSLRMVVANGQLAVTQMKSDSRAAQQHKAVLGHIQESGEDTQKMFAAAISELFSARVSSFITLARNCASLVVEIMDRNLYERSNDARWWVLNSMIRCILSKKEISNTDRDTLRLILSKINSLYTVYLHLVVFDTSGRIIVASNRDGAGSKSHPQNGSMDVVEGDFVEGDWVQATLFLSDSLKYCVSQFERTDLYGGKPTYIYGAGIRSISDPKEVVGGIGVVFDAGPEFQRMLDEYIPPIPGAYGLFVEKESGKVLASSSASGWAIGQIFPIDSEFCALEKGKTVGKLAVINGAYCIVAGALSQGYREFKVTDGYSNPILSFMIIPIGEPPKGIENSRKQLQYNPTDIHGRPQNMLVFSIGDNFFAIPAEQAIKILPSDIWKAGVVDGNHPSLAGRIKYVDGGYGGDAHTHFIDLYYAANLLTKKQEEGVSYENAIIIRSKTAPSVKCPQGISFIFGLLVGEIEGVITFDESSILSAHGIFPGVSARAINLGEKKGVIVVIDDDFLSTLNPVWSMQKTKHPRASDPGDFSFYGFKETSYKALLVSQEWNIYKMILLLSFYKRF